LPLEWTRLGAEVSASFVSAHVGASGAQELEVGRELVGRLEGPERRGEGLRSQNSE